MSMISTSARASHRSAGTSDAPVGIISGLLWRLRTRIEERRTLVRLSRLSPHLIRDMGIDPDDVYAALKGSWDEVGPFGDGRK